MISSVPFQLQNILRSEQGSSLVANLVVVGLLSLVSLCAYMLILDTKQRLVLEQTRLGLESIRENLIVALANQVAWEFTVSHPENADAFACLRNQSCDPNMSYLAFPVLVGPDNKPIFENINGNVGFQLTSMNWDDSSAIAPVLTDRSCLQASSLDDAHIQCPFSLRSAWRPICAPDPMNPAVTCLNPMIDLRIDFQISHDYALAKGARFNTSALAIQMKPGVF
jgi:hypothetical protein